MRVPFSGGKPAEDHKMKIEHRFEITDAIEDPRWDSFVRGIEGGHHVQTSMWAQVKASLGWKTIRLLASSEGRIVGGAQVLTHGYPLIGSVGYVTKGPLSSMEGLTEELIDELIWISRDYRLRFLAVQPPNNAHPMASLLAAKGFEASNMETTPVGSILIDLAMEEDRILAQTKRQTRQNINRGIREGVEISEGTGADMKTFYRLYTETAGRQGFLPYKIDYFETMRRVLEPSGSFKLLFAKYRGEPVSVLLLVPFRDTVIAKTLGWSGLYRDVRPNETLFWGAIRWAKANGYRFFDLEGIDPAGAKMALNGQPLPDHVIHSPDQLKYGFGGTVTLYPEPYELASSPLIRRLLKCVHSEAGRENFVSKIVDAIKRM